MRGWMLAALGASILLLPGCDRPDRPDGAAANAAANSSQADAGAKAAQDRRAILRLESEWAAALVARDTAWFDRHVAPDYSTIVAGGRIVPRSEVVALVRNSPPARDLRIEQAEVRLLGDTAVATVTQSFTLASGRPARLRITDVWRRSGKGWVAVHSHESNVAAERR